MTAVILFAVLCPLRRIPAAAVLSAALACNCAAAAGREQPAEKTSPADALWLSACSRFERRDYRAARAGFNEFTLRHINDPRYIHALYRRGLCEHRAGDCGRAVKTWEKVYNLEKLHGRRSKFMLQALNELARYYAANGDDRHRDAYMKKMLDVFPAADLTVVLHVECAEKCMDRGEYAQAASWYRKVAPELSARDRENARMAAMIVGETAKDPRKLLHYANENLEHNQLERAIELYEVFLDRFETSEMTLEAKTRLGWCLYMKREYGKAERLWKEVIRKSSKNDEWAGKSRWHLIQLNAGPHADIEEAIDLCDVQAEEFRNRFHAEQALFVKAWLLQAHRKWASALEAFNDLIRAYPQKAKHPAIQDYMRQCRDKLAPRG